MSWHPSSPDLNCIENLLGNCQKLDVLEIISTTLEKRFGSPFKTRELGLTLQPVQSCQAQ